MNIPNIYSKEEKDLIVRAFEFANTKHAGQKRASGEPYIVHPVEVAEILMKHKFAAPIVAAGLLHDVLEDTDAVFSNLELEFGLEISKMVNAVTKSKKMAWVVHHHPEKKCREYHHYFLEIIKDPHAAVVKTADRLSNMRTIEFLSPRKQHKNAIETLDMYVPLAKAIGLNDVAQELATICHTILSAKEYDEIIHSSVYHKEIQESCSSESSFLDFCIS